MNRCQQADNGLTRNVFFDHLFDTMKTRTSERAITTGTHCFKVEEWISIENLGKQIQQPSLQEIS